MRARELEIRLAKLLDYPEGQIDQRVRPLRDGGVLPTGGRGLHAPDIQAPHAAAMLLQLVALRATDALGVGLRAMNLQFVPVPGVPGAFFGYSGAAQLTFGGALAYLLSDPAAKWFRVEVACDGGRAWIMIEHNGQPLELLFDGDAEVSASFIDGDLHSYRQQGVAYFGHRFVMGAGQVKQIGIWLSRGQETPAIRARHMPDQVTPRDFVESFRELLAASSLPRNAEADA